MVIHKIVKNFTEGLPPMNSAEIAAHLGIPVGIVRDIIYDLICARIVSETLTREIRDVAYQPALDPDKITISYVFDIIDNLGQQVTFDKECLELEKVSGIIDSFYEDVRNSPKNTTIKSL
jgi:membrane protein